MSKLDRLWGALAGGSAPVSRPVGVERTVPYTPKEIFDLVQDVEAYPDFLPHCQSLEVHARHSSSMEVSMKVGVVGMGIVLKTKNTWVPEQRITLMLNPHQPFSPFQHFEGIWKFEPMANGRHCHVVFEANFQVTHALAASMIDKLISRLSEEMIGAFETRAKRIYGVRTPVDSTAHPCVG